MTIIMKNVKVVLVAVSLALMTQSCSQTTSFLKSSIVPAAEGNVTIKNDKNDNYAIDLEVIRLAEPQRLTPPKNVYVVWMRTGSGEMKNIGQLRSSTGFMSNTLKSSLETVTSFKPTEIVITAEENETEKYPGLVVLTTGGF
jgi:hypothetical protein